MSRLWMNKAILRQIIEATKGSEGLNEPNIIAFTIYVC